MAWLMQTKVLARYVPKVETIPSGIDLTKRRNVYGREHPELFPRRSEWTCQGVFLPDDLFPVRACIKSRHKSLPDAINLAGFGFSERLKDIVESVEPGVHQFHEVPVFMPSGEPAPMRYFAAIIGHIATDQVVVEASTIGPGNPKGFSKIKAPTPQDHNKIAIDRAKTPGWHLWDSWDIYLTLTVSDRLREKIIGSGVHCFDFTRLIEIDAEQEPFQ